MIKIALSLAVLLNLSNAKMFQSVSKNEATILQQGKEAKYCANCGMDLVMFYKTNHLAKIDGKITQFCSLHCIADAIRSGKKVTDIKVVDVKTLKFIDARKAYYVVGSKVKGTMSKVSKYAFKNLNDAKELEKKYGGEIVDFDKALEIAKKDFKN